MDDRIKILYISKIRDSKTCGVTVAVLQLFEYIYAYADVDWLDLGNNDFKVNSAIRKVTVDNFLEKGHPDIAVFEDPFNSIEFCKIAKKLRRLNIPYVIFPHGCFHYLALQRKAFKKKVAMTTVFRSFLRGCAAVQFLTADEMRNSYQSNKSLVIPNGIKDNNHFRIRNEIKEIVFIGRKDVENKGLDMLFPAVLANKEILIERGINVHIYGSKESDEDEKYINGYIEKNGLTQVLHNHGPVFDQEKDEILYEADVFVQTSRHEGFPMSILEALSYGLPVFITDGTNLTDIVKGGQAGWCMETSEQAITDSFTKLLNLNNISSFSANARELGNYFNWDSVCKQTIKEYKRLVAVQAP